MNLKWSLKKIVMTALACTLIGFGALMLLYRIGVIDNATIDLDVQKELDVSTVQAFSLETDTTPITVVPTTGDQLRIKLSGRIREADAKYAKIELDNRSGEVKAIARTDKRFSIGIDVTRLFQLFSNQLEVTVELPEKVYRSLSFTSDTGRITLPELQADMLEIKGDTGEVRLDGFTGKSLSARNDTGTMRLNHLSAKLSLRTDTGHIIAGLDALPAAADVQTDTGDIRLTLAKVFPADVNFATDTGKTTLQIPSQDQFSSKRMEKRRIEGQLSGGGPLLQARSDTGDIELVVE